MLKHLNWNYSDFQLDFVVCELILYFFTHEYWLLKTKYGQTIETGEGLRSDVWKRTCQPASRWLPKTPGSDTEKGLSGFIQITAAAFLCSLPSVPFIRIASEKF